MKTEEKLIELLLYYRRTRKKGHTTLMKKGTDNVENKFILSHRKKDYRFLGVSPKQVITWNSLKSLRGHDKPLAIDNAAMDSLLTDTIELIEELREKQQKGVKSLLRQQRENCYISAKIDRFEYNNPYSNSDGQVERQINKNSILNAEEPNINI